MAKKYFKKDIEKIPVKKFESIGKVKINNDNEPAEYSGPKLKKYIKEEIVPGGKTKYSIGEKLKKAGVVLSQSEKRKKLLNLVGDNKPSARQLNKMKRAEARRKSRLAAQAKASALLIEGRNDPLHKVFRGQKTETSEHIGVRRQRGKASVLTDNFNASNRASAQSVQVSSAGIKSTRRAKKGLTSDSPVPEQQARGLSGQTPNPLEGTDPDKLVPGVGAIAPQTEIKDSNRTKPISSEYSGLGVASPSFINKNGPPPPKSTRRNFNFGIRRSR